MSLFLSFSESGCCSVVVSTLAGNVGDLGSIPVGGLVGAGVTVGVLVGYR